jgi:hypothetical protein
MADTSAWDRWLAAKDTKTEERARVLLERFRAAGCNDDPEGWVRSEIDEDIAQLARFVFLRRVWHDNIQHWRGTTRIDRWPLAQKLVAGEGSLEELAFLCGAIATETVRSMLDVLDDVLVDMTESESPGWRLMEVDRATGELTGRTVDALHESLSEVADPGDPFL